MAINFFLLLLSLLINVSLALFVLSRNYKNLSNISFAALVLNVAAWTGSIAGILITGNLYLWVRLSFVFGSALSGIFLIFALLFAPKPRWRLGYWALLILPAFFVAVSIYDITLLIKGVTIVGSSVQPTASGQLYPMLVLYGTSYTLAGLVIMFKRLRKATGLFRVQMKYALLGIAGFAVIATLTNLILPYFGINEFNGLGPLSSLIMVSAITYTMIRYRFLDIKIVVETVLVYLIATFLTGAVLLFIEDVLYWKTKIPQNPLNLIILLVAVLFFPLLKRVTHRLFLVLEKPRHDSGRSIKHLAESLTQLVNLKEMTQVIDLTIAETFNIEQVVTVVFEEGKTEFFSLNNLPYPESLGTLIHQGQLIRYLNDFKAPLIKQELELLSRSRDNEVADKIHVLIADCPFEMYMPLVHQNKLMGLICLTAKKDQEPFNKHDILTLETIVYQAAIGISNGIFYKRLHDLNLNLKKKVTEQTKHLNDLLRVKDEFIKITSHQLRTPTTIVKGMLSMILEGSLDNDESKKRQYLEQAYTSSVNLEKIIHGILGAADKTASSLVMTFEPVDLKEIAQKLIEERGHLAAQKNLTLKFVDAPGAIPKVLADKLKIREALANLIDNAINYTPKGEVCISLDATDQWVTCSVKDSGIGIPEAEKSRIFKKFTRTPRSTMLNPNGSGLGLYIVKQIVDAHHGYVALESEENKGTLFKINIPAHNA
ncbi:ATP-binding protein [Candidatus Uhrbacteria bacterium]|nr:ATP-binding protein [Candidatus Uhrbacteria bacterium]